MPSSDSDSESENKEDNGYGNKTALCVDFTLLQHRVTTTLLL